MSTPPPFKLASGPGSARYGAACCEQSIVEAEPAGKAGRLKLADLDTHFQCSIIGTCMSTAALRKVMARFIHVQDVSDLDIHHEAVLLSAEPGAASKALHKALDHQHESTLLRFSRVSEAPQLLALWEEALRNGDIPGAYWALLTHRHSTLELRKKVFGDVHMLSHLVGAANRADIRRLMALEQSNAELREQVDQYQERHLAREHTLQQLQRELGDARLLLSAAARPPLDSPALREQQHKLQAATEQVALQTQRREAAEQASATAQACAAQLADESDYLRKHAATLAAELAGAESQLRDLAEHAGGTGLELGLAGRRIFYVGGRPSSTPSIRALVERHGGDFRHHDGGLEDRKGLLAAGVGWADLVVFPVDCVDHDSVGHLKRLCARHGIEFWPLRSAGVGSFAAALAASARPVRDPKAEAEAESDPHRPCPRHG